MRNKEIAMCLSIIKKNTKDIHLIVGEDTDRHITIIKDIKKENVTWVIDEAIKALKEGEEE